MRLLKTGPKLPGHSPDDERIELVEHFGSEIPPYVILSHRWGKDEVLFADIQNKTAARRKAYPKLKSAFMQARRDGYDHVWIDTCCIDKSSSAELSEAINSMYEWYHNAQKCYAYLADVIVSDEPTMFDSQFRSSEWFKRGWTLQELLAPTDLQFYSQDWMPLGDRVKLQTLISESTHIDVDYLTGFRPLTQASVATKMSWAASRQTTRDEDRAYCLLGLFSVNMPMLYGEGLRAFIRLQEEIMKHSDDHSIFAWTTPESISSAKHGLLADSPAAFVQSGSIIQWDPTWQNPYDMSNKGLGIELPLTRLDENLYEAALDCHQDFQPDRYLGIYLMRLNTGSNQYARVNCHKLGTGHLNQRGSVQKVFVRQAFPDEGLSQPPQFFQLRGLCPDDISPGLYTVSDMVFPTTLADNAKQLPNETSQARSWVPNEYPTVFEIPKGSRKLAVAILLSRSWTDGEAFTILLGSITEFQVGYCIYEAQSLEGGFTAMQKKFDTYVGPMGDILVTDCHGDCHHVRVVVHPHMYHGRKIFVTDIDVKPLSRKNLTEAVVDHVQTALAESPVQRFNKMSGWLRGGKK